jgi:hypothetical protein
MQIYNYSFNLNVWFGIRIISQGGIDSSYFRVFYLLRPVDFNCK